MAYWVLSTSYTPYDDVNQRITHLEISSSNPAMDTSNFDDLREGISIRRIGDLLQSSQTKMLANPIDEKTTIINHQQEQCTFGIASDYTKFFNTVAFADRPKFDAVLYLRFGHDYPLPIAFNDGPQTEEEGFVEVFPEPFIRPALELRDNFVGSFESGNQLEGIKAGTSVCNNIVELLQPISPRPWLCEGGGLFGAIPTGSILIQGFTSTIQQKLSPWNDCLTVQTPNCSGSVDTTMHNALAAMSSSVNELQVNTRYATSGFTDYHNNNDSLQYIGWRRGS